MTLLNKPTCPVQRQALANQIFQVNEEIAIGIVAKRGMLDVQGYDERGICRSSVERQPC